MHIYVGITYGVGRAEVGNVGTAILVDEDIRLQAALQLNVHVCGQSTHALQVTMDDPFTAKVFESFSDLTCLSRLLVEMRVEIGTVYQWDFRNLGMLSQICIEFSVLHPRHDNAQAIGIV